MCLADFGDCGVAFVAQPQIPPRNVNWSSSGKWVHQAKIAFEKFFLHKMRKGTSETFYEKVFLDLVGIAKLKKSRPEPADGGQPRIYLIYKACCRRGGLVALTWRANSRSAAMFPGLRPQKHRRRKFACIETCRPQGRQSAP